MENNNIIEDGVKYKYICSAGDFKFYYSIKNLIGEGGSGKVYKGLKVKGLKKEIVAIKKFSPSKKNEDIAYIERESLTFSNLNKLKHENILTLFHFEKKKDDYYLIMEMCDSDFVSYLKKKNTRLSEFEYIDYFLQLSRAIKVIHQFEYIHRDIKPLNLLIQNNKLKICDFGLARKIGIDWTKYYMGTLHYSAPERYNASEEYKYDKSSDIFSMGVTFYFFLFGLTPWEFIKKKNNLKLNLENQGGTYETIKLFEEEVKNGNILSVFPENICISEEIRLLILKMIKIDQNERPKIKEIEENLKEIIMKKVSEKVFHEYENLLFLHDTLEILYKLLKCNIVNSRESLEKVIFILAKMHFYLVSYLLLNLKNLEMQIWFPKEIWREFYESDDYCDLTLALKLMQKTSNENFENIQTSYDDDQMKKYFNNQDIGVDFLIDLENYGCKLLEENLDLLENYDEKETEERTLIYKGFYGLIIIMTWRNSLAFIENKKRKIINLNDDLDSNIRKRIFFRIKNCIKMHIY